MGAGCDSWPYNLDITPDGRLALTADNDNNGGSDGNVDTVDEDISVLRVDGDTATNTGTLLKLPGKPASMQGRTN